MNSPEGSAFADRPNARREERQRTHGRVYSRVRIPWKEIPLKNRQKTQAEGNFERKVVRYGEPGKLSQGRWMPRKSGIPWSPSPEFLIAAIVLISTV